MSIAADTPRPSSKLRRSGMFARGAMKSTVVPIFILIPFSPSNLAHRAEASVTLL
jgi:hypothetical protein